MIVLEPPLLVLVVFDPVVVHNHGIPMVQLRVVLLAGVIKEVLPSRHHRFGQELHEKPIASHVRQRFLKRRLDQPAAVGKEDEVSRGAKLRSKQSA